MNIPASLRTFIPAVLVFLAAGMFSAPAFASFATQSAELSVTAGIMPKPEHFQFGFTSDLTGAASADQEIEYTVTYGSMIDYGTPMVIETQWSLGNVREEHLFNYEIVSYVPGSATKDYWGESTPVIDMKRRTITWTITRFPPNTLDKTLRFKLKTPGRYVTEQEVGFSVTARMRTGQIGVGEITLDQLYNPTEFIRREVRGLQILSADVRRITDTSFTLYLVTSVPSKATIFYGTDPDDLSLSVSDPLLTDQKTILIDGLTPATTYYFRILIENANGIQRKTPEIFTVTTAAHSLLSLIDQERLIVTSRGVSLKPEFGSGGTSILVPTGNQLDFYIPFISVPPDRVFLSVSSTNVLGTTHAASSEQATITLPGMQKIRLLETQHKVFTGRLPVPKHAGNYDIFIETANDTGTVNQDVIFSATISNPLTVQDSQGKPIEKALVYIERYSTQSKAFERFPSESYGAKNPGYTRSDGSADFLLPDGEYTITVDALGYAPAESKFTLIPGSKEHYPTIVMPRSPLAVGSVFRYYVAAGTDLLLTVNSAVHTIAESGRFLDIGLLTGIIILTVLSTLMNLKRIRLTGEAVYIFLEKWLRRTLRHERTATMLIGFTEDADSGLPLHGVSVFLLYPGAKTVVSRDLSNAIGEFRLRFAPGETYDLVARKPGYAQFRTRINSELLLDEPIPPVSLKSETHTELPAALELLRELSGTLFHGLSDTLILGVTALSVWMTLRIGMLKMAPILIVSAVNLVLWFEFHLAGFRNRRSHKKSPVTASG